MTDPHMLHTDLIRHQETGNFASQADVLMALAHLAHEDEAYSLAQGLYGQAWAAYEQADDKRGMAKTILRLTEIMRHFAWRDDFAATTTRIDITRLHALARSP
jgi:hypothetical protein